MTSGCWQEVHYQDDLAAITAEKSSAAETDDAVEILPPVPQSRPFESEKLETIENERNLPSEEAETGNQPPSLLVPAEEENLPEPDKVVTAVVDPFAEKSKTKTAEQITEPTPSTVSEPTGISGSTTETHALTWSMSSEWSMAAALQAKGQPAERYAGLLERANQTAKELQVEIAELPVAQETDTRLAVILTYLLETAGPSLAEDLRQKHGKDHAALAELATKTHVLLLSYTPTSTRLDPVIRAIRQAAENSGLPKEVYQELLVLLAERADFKQVKAAIYQLHKRAQSVLDTLGD